MKKLYLLLVFILAFGLLVTCVSAKSGQVLEKIIKSDDPGFQRSITVGLVPNPQIKIVTIVFKHSSKKGKELLYVKGRIKKTTHQRISNVFVTADFFDNNDRHIARAGGQVFPKFLLAGSTEYGQFKISLDYNSSVSWCKIGITH